VTGTDVTVARAWAIWACGALFYAYGFFQRVAPSVMIDELMAAFSVHATALGQLSAAYFYTYALLQIPIGLMLDRFGPRLVMAGAAFLCALGSALFGLAEGLALATIGRLCVGAGAAVTWIGVLYLAFRHLPPSAYAVATGLAMATGMAGAVGGQAPLSLAVAALGWRQTMLAGAGVALLLAAALWLLIPATGRRVLAADRPALGESLGLAGGLKATWALAFFAASAAGPMLAFAGLWGVPYLMVGRGLTRPEAAWAVSLVMIGWGCAGPIATTLERRFGLDRLVLMAGAVASAVLAWALLLAWPAMPVALLLAVLVVMGLSGAAMVLSFALARDLADPRAAGTVSGIINTAVMGAGAVLQPVVGWLLDLQWDGSSGPAGRHYHVGAYEGAFLALPLVILCGSAMLPLLRRFRLRSNHVQSESTERG